MPNITILGSGFGALTAIRALRRRGVKADITVLSPRPALHYLPSSIWIPSGAAAASDLKIPLAGFFKRYGATFIETSVTGLRDGGRTVETDKGIFTNDQLVIATGGRLVKKLPGIEHALIPCEGLDAAEEIGRRLKSMDGGTIALGFSTNPNEQGAVRGGPVFEYAFIIDTMLRRQGRRDKFDLVFFNPAERPGQRLGPKAVDALLAEMKRRGIRTVLGEKLVRFEADRVVTDKSEIQAGLIIFMPGITGPKWLENTGLPLSPGGMIKADSKCRVEGLAGVWVVGDAGSYPGPEWLAKQAHQADLQAKAAAANIDAVLRASEPVTDFKAELVCIVDALDSGMLVYRSESRTLVSPRMWLFHWMKKAFEGLYLRPYR
ncbi:MAG: FAD/NAD(P)-binding oxidoreductase [Rhizobiaceae bacterium]